MIMEYQEFTGKTVDAAITEATIQLGTTSDKIEYEVVQKGSNGILGFGSKKALIKVKIIATPEEKAKEFITEVTTAMGLEVKVEVTPREENSSLEIELFGEEMGVLIGKRGQTLDALQYLTNLAVNKDSEDYHKIKVDTEDYRKRRKATLENLAKNISYKVKRTKRSVSLEPMNPYERRVIHSALQGDRYISTHSEGEEPYRHVVVTLRR